MAFECGRSPVSYFKADCIKPKLHRESPESDPVSRCVLFSCTIYTYILQNWISCHHVTHRRFRLSVGVLAFLEAPGPKSCPAALTGCCLSLDGVTSSKRLHFLPFPLPLLYHLPGLPGCLSRATLMEVAHSLI